MQPEQPKLPEATPEHGQSPEAAEHAEHGIPPAVHDAEPTGLPTSDRHHNEVTPTKPA